MFKIKTGNLINQFGNYGLHPHLQGRVFYFRKEVVNVYEVEPARYCTIELNDGSSAHYLPSDKELDLKIDPVGLFVVRNSDKEIGIVTENDPVKGICIRKDNGIWFGNEKVLSQEFTVIYPGMMLKCAYTGELTGIITSIDDRGNALNPVITMTVFCDYQTDSYTASLEKLVSEWDYV